MKETLCLRTHVLIIITLAFETETTSLVFPFLQGHEYSCLPKGLSVGLWMHPTAKKTKMAIYKFYNISPKYHCPAKTFNFFTQVDDNNERKSHPNNWQKSFKLFKRFGHSLDHRDILCAEPCKRVWFKPSPII